MGRRTLSSILYPLFLFSTLLLLSITAHAQTYHRYGEGTSRGTNYDPATSGLTAKTIQAAIDEIDAAALTAEADTHGTVTGRGRTDYGANSIANRLQTGKDANDHWGQGHDATEGLFFDCWAGGTRGNCDKGPKLNTDKYFLVKDRNNAVLWRTQETTDGVFYEMRERTVDPTGNPPTGYWWMYPKSGGMYAEDDAGAITKLGRTQYISVCEPAGGNNCFSFTDLPAAFTEANAVRRKFVDLSQFTQFRLSAFLSVAAVTGDITVVCDANSTFASTATLGTLDNPPVNGTVGSWTAIPANECATAGGVWITFGMINGNTTEDPTVRSAGLELR